MACRPTTPNRLRRWWAKLSVLVEHQHAFDFRTGDEEELLVLVGRKFLEALVQEQ